MRAPLTHPPAQLLLFAHAAASLHSALAPGEEAFQGMQKAEEGRFGSRDGGIQGRGGRRR